MHTAVSRFRGSDRGAELLQTTRSRSSRSFASSFFSAENTPQHTARRHTKRQRAQRERGWLHFEIDQKKRRRLFPSKRVAAAASLQSTLLGRPDFPQQNAGWTRREGLFPVTACGRTPLLLLARIPRPGVRAGQSLPRRSSRRVRTGGRAKSRRHRNHKVCLCVCVSVHHARSSARAAAVAAADLSLCWKKNCLRPHAAALHVL